MKKFTLLFAVAAILSLSAVGVSAKPYTPENDSYTITYNVGETNAGSMYGLLAIKGTGIGVSTTNTDAIVYIDQATADEEGNITFTAFAPKGDAPSESSYEVSTVFIGGPGLSGATEIGTLEAEAVAITGKVFDAVNTKTAATVTVLDGEDVVKSTHADADGTFSIDVSAGTYSVKFEKPNFCSVTYKNVAVDADNVVIPEVDMTELVGDIATDGCVGFDDLQAFLNEYNNEGKNIDSDFDENTYVELADLQAFLGGYTSENIVIDYSQQ